MLGQTANMQTGDAMEVEQDETFMVEELEALGVNAGDGTCPIKTLSVLLSLHFTSTHPFFPSSLLPFFPSSLLPFFPLHLSTHAVKKLRDNGIYTLKQLRSITTKTLLSIKGFSDAKVTKIISAAKKKIAWNEFYTAGDVLIKQNALCRISTGSSDLDELLGGGVQTGYLTEIYGEAGAGKTQLMFTLAINAMTSEDPGKVAWIDTEGAFSAQRVREIAAQKGFENPTEALDNIAVMHAVNHELQMQAPTAVYALCANSDAPYKLIVIDSIIATFRAEFNGRGELSGRQQKLGQHLDMWKKIAANLGIAVVYSNQICSDPGNMVRC